MSEGTWLRWAWRYYVLEVDQHDTFEDAVKSAWHAWSYGDEAFICIEGPDGVVEDADVREWFASLDATRRAELAVQPERPYAIKLEDPDGKDLAWYDTYESEAERDAAAARLRERFGERVKPGMNPWEGRDA